MIDNKLIMSIEQQSHREQQPEISQQLVRAFKIFANRFLAEPQFIYYPSSSTDTSPSVVFPNSRIVYLDIDDKAISSLQRQGYEAVHDSALQYSLSEQSDLLLLLSPFVSYERPARNLKVGGYIFCNNWHHTARDISRSDEFELVGVIPDTKTAPTQELITDKVEMQKCLDESEFVSHYFVFRRVKESQLTAEHMFAEDWETAHQLNSDQDIQVHSEDVSIDDI